MTHFHCPAHQWVEWTLEAQKPRANPWEDISLHAIMTSPGQPPLRIPAFWDGGNTWKFRITSPQPGPWSLCSECSDADDQGLHHQQAKLEVTPAQSNHNSALLRHGAVRLAANGKHFEHHDGTPFHWLGDTWWMLMSDRVHWPTGFAQLTARRAEQGFTLVQTVVGFPCDTTDTDPISGNEGGMPWSQGYQSINPAYYQACDRKLTHLVESGIVPCILGCWGYHLLFMGKQKMIAHWRYLVARYGALPVIWTLAGEAAMHYYLSKDREGDSKKLIDAWPDVARAVREYDPWQRLITLHPRRASWDDTADAATLDFHMMQPGHMPLAPKIGVETTELAKKKQPGKLLVNAEPPYEGHAGCNGAEVQRYSFWSSMLSGAMGYTYGAAGIFQANDRQRPTGNRPDGGAFDAVFWDESMMYPGAQQIAAGHRLLQSLHYHLFEPHPEWVTAGLRWGVDAYPIPFRAYAAGIAGVCRVIYLPVRWYHWEGPRVNKLEPGVRYRAAYVQTDTLQRHELGVVAGDAQGHWQAPTLPHLFDWLLVMTRV